MVSLDAVRAHNAGLKNLGSGLVAVFVGGTSGIGETTAREFARHTVEPRIYLIGRNQTEAFRIIDELTKLNPDGKISFVQTDASLLSSVDKACDEIKDKENKINLLFLSPGVMTMKGRQETEEGLDKKFNLHYYSRMRFTTNLMPLLSKAAQTTPSLSRVVSVLSAGHEGKLYLNDLALKTHYSTKACADHATTMTSLAIGQLASRHPETTFVHAYPSFVKTSLARDMGKLGRCATSLIFTVASSWMVPIGQSGERHLFAATSMRYPPKSANLSTEEVEKGVDGVRGSGAYPLNWDGSYSQNEKVMGEYRSHGIGQQVWEHTLDVFNKVRGTGSGKY